MSRGGLVTLIVANLFVAFQTLRHEWGYYETLLIYWSEVVILGAYNVFRLAVVGLFGAAPLGTWAARWLDLGSWFSRVVFTAVGVGFFVLKFGAFALGIGLFVLLLPAMLRAEGEGATSVPRALMAAGPGLLIATGALCLSHGVSLVRNFLMGREYDRINVIGLVFLPYARMSLVGVVLLLGIGVAGLVPGLGRETAFAVVMVLFKLLADVASHRLEHGRLSTDPKSTGLAQ